MANQWIIDCPHCKKLVEIAVVVNINESPIYQGECVDCFYLEKGGSHLPKGYVAWCGLQGNTNPLFFTQEDIDNKKNYRVDRFEDFQGIPKCVRFRQKEQDPPHHYQSNPHHLVEKE